MEDYVGRKLENACKAVRDEMIDCAATLRGRVSDELSDEQKDAWNKLRSLEDKVVRALSAVEDSRPKNRFWGRYVAEEVRVYLELVAWENEVVPSSSEQPGWSWQLNDTSNRINPQTEGTAETREAARAAVLEAAAKWIEGDIPALQLHAGLLRTDSLAIKWSESTAD